MSSLCHSCRTLGLKGQPRCAGDARTHVARSDRASCTSCGVLLPGVDATEEMLSKLLQLERFGIGAAGSPLLECAWPDLEIECADEL